MSRMSLPCPTCSLSPSTCKHHNNSNNNNDNDSHDLAGFSKRLFHLTTYSLASAVLMGSSIGIVVFQSQQMSMSSPTITTTTTVGAAAVGSGPEPCPILLSPYLQSSFSTTLISAWIPLIVWLVTLMATTVLVRRKQFVPRVVSARHAILISQAVFGVFWVLIAGVQEVQDQMLLTISTTTPKTETAMIAQEKEDTLFVLHQQRQYPQVQALRLSHTNAQTYTAQSMRMPLCVVWYMAVMLLGMATGLVTTSSTLLERQLERDLSESNNQASAITQGDNKHQHQQNIDEKSIVCVSSPPASPKWSLSCMQRMTLGMLVLVLFSLQMLFFQWIVTSSVAITGDTTTEDRILTSTCLTLFGLLSSITMMALGAKFIPAVHEPYPQIAI